MRFFHELFQFIYQTIIVALSIVFYGLFLCIWGITYPLYWIYRFIVSFFTSDKESTKTVVITGAGSGMGKMLAVRYAAMKCHILIIDVNENRLKETESLCKEAGAASVTYYVLDVTDTEKTKTYLEGYDDQHPVDTIYPCAALNDTPRRPLPNIVSDFSKIFSVNVIGVYNVINPLLPRMQQRRSGRICLFSSILGFGGSLITPNYTVTKNCMRAIAESLRFPLKKYNISISYVCPGGVKTGMTSVLPKWLTCFFITAETAAKMIINGCEHGDYLIVFPFSCYSICYGFLSGPAFLRESLEAILNIVYRGLFDPEFCKST